MAKSNRKHPQIVKMIDLLSGSKGAWEVWNDIIRMFAISLSNAFDAGVRKINRENMYLAIVKKYTIEEQNIIAKICAEITIFFEMNPEQDLLGDLYMNLDFGSNALGQFFTPYSVCQIMAETTFDNEYLYSKVSDNGYIRINEPACGAGANIIALANAMKKRGINYQQSAFFIAQDLSQLTALMCYIQLSLLGCAAIIVTGDTLEKPFAVNSQTEIELSENIWLTPMYYSDIWKMRRNAKLIDEILS